MLLFALLLVLTGTTAFAHCRPENRVWDFSEKPADFASQENANLIAASKESAAYGYDFASGVHKYLYCQNEPVNMTDPSGHESLVSINFTMGIMAQQMSLEMKGAAGALNGARAMFGASDGINSLIDGLNYANIIADYAGMAFAAAGVSKAMIGLGMHLAPIAQSSLAAMSGIERAFVSSPGASTALVGRGLRKCFATTLAEMGIKLKVVAGGGSYFKSAERTVYLDRTTANSGTLLDEFSHAFGFATGKGANLPEELQGIYAGLRNTLKAVGGDTAKLSTTDCTVYHQLELLNVMKGLNGELPACFNAVSQAEIDAFLAPLENFL